MFHKFLSILLSWLYLFSVQGFSASAAPSKKYTPTTERKPVSDSEAAGSRGCDRAMGTTPLVFLTPREPVQPTLSRHPTFVWYLPQPVSVPLRFTLIQPGTPAVIYRQEIRGDKAGIFVLKLPAHLPDLSANQEYRWTVTLVCNDLKPSSNISLWARLKPISTPVELPPKLSSATSRSERSKILREAGLWHDAYEVWYDSVPENTIRILDKNSLPEDVQRQLEQKEVFSFSRDNNE